MCASCDALHVALSAKDAPGLRVVFGSIFTAAPHVALERVALGKAQPMAPGKDAGHPIRCQLEEHIWAGVMGPADSGEPCSDKTSDLSSKGLTRTKKSLCTLWNESFRLQRQVLLLVLPSCLYQLPCLSAPEQPEKIARLLSGYF